MNLEFTSISNEPTLTAEERSRKTQLEKAIDSSLQSYQLIGASLLELRDARLYRDTHTTFEGYVEEVHDMARSTAYQYIEAAKIVEELSADPEVQVLPKNESQCRALNDLPREEVVPQWKKLVASGEKITAARIQSIVSQFIAKRTGEQPKSPGNPGIAKAMFPSPMRAVSQAEESAETAEIDDELTDEGDLQEETDTEFDDFIEPSADFINGDWKVINANLSDKAVKLLFIDQAFAGSATKTAEDRVAEMLAGIDEKLADDCHILAFVEAEDELTFRNVLDDAGLEFRGHVIWAYSCNEAEVGKTFRRAHGLILHYVKGDPSVSPAVADVIKCEKDMNGHPGQKPLGLIQTLIDVTTKVGDCVCDPFANVGSTVIAAKIMGRTITAAESDPNLHQKGLARLAMLPSQN